MPLISSFYGALIDIELRREELIADWSLAVQGQPVERVEPLR